MRRIKMTEMARKGTRFLAIAAGTVVLGAAVVLATTAPSPRAEVSPAPAPTVEHAVARPAPHPPEPPEPPEAPEPPRARRAWLGIVMSGEDTEISSVADGSPADEAGLKRGDRIVEINGKDVKDAADVVDEIRSLDPGDTVKLRIERDGSERTVTATLEGRRVAEPRVFHFRSPGAAPFAWHGGDMVGPSRGFLGVEVHPMSDDLREYFRAPRNAGLLVNRVVEDSPAEKAGMKAGDVIVSVDGEEIERIGDISRALRDHEPGDTVDVKVVREGSERTLKVELDERSEPRTRRRSLLIPHGEGDGDDDVVIGITPEVHQEIRRAIEESMRGMHESLKALPKMLHDEDVIRLEINEEIREETRKAREVAREARRAAREAARRARFVRHSFDI
jgi:membrane-associated protease RseP (regulator of RpoE activity)